MNDDIVVEEWLIFLMEVHENMYFNTNDSDDEVDAVDDDNELEEWNRINPIQLVGHNYKLMQVVPQFNVNAGPTLENVVDSDDSPFAFFRLFLTDRLMT